MYEVGEHKYNHLFDPLAMLQRFHIEDGEVTYQCRYLQSDAYKANIAANRIVVAGLGTSAVPDPCKNVFQRFMSYFVDSAPLSDNNLISFFPCGDNLYANGESACVHRIDPNTLDVIKRVELIDYMPMNTMAAHPHIGPDGTLYSIGVSFQKSGVKTCITKTPPIQDQESDFVKGESVACIKSPRLLDYSYVHSFAMTENFYVYVEQPVLIDLIKVLSSTLRQQPLDKVIRWSPDIKARFRVIHKATGEELSASWKPGERKTLVFEAEAFMVYHHINAYEENDHLVMDLVAYSNGELLENVYLKNYTSEQCENIARAMKPPQARRYVLPLNVSAENIKEDNIVKLPKSNASAKVVAKYLVHCEHEAICDEGFEMPQINYAKYNSKPYHYAYGLGVNNTEKNLFSLVKADVQERTHLKWEEDGCYPSEPVFVGNPDRTTEDDGVIISAINTVEFDKGRHAFLLILDARTMSEIARAEFPDVERFPRDLHGLFRADGS
ncbi:retinal Mueller cells isomerohydrolase-like isoform X2 [Mya arenaria]|nr:retinal Mueller cells isomerohydrolase-like isoform X2 [Mya arenaria]